MNLESQKKILVVEDDGDIRNLLEMALTLEGYRVETANNGRDALDTLQKSEVKPDAIVLDLMMPVMDGMQALAAIRTKEAGTGAHLPVLMVTAHIEPGDLARFKLAGADGYVAKPLDMKQLQAECLRVLA